MDTLHRYTNTISDTGKINIDIQIQEGIHINIRNNTYERMHTQGNVLVTWVEGFRLPLGC